MTVQIKKQHPAKNGFTLTELLVAVVIMVVIGVIFTDTLVESLRGRNKVSAINQIKQNGQVVLDKLSNEIRAAEKVICVDKFGGGTTPKDTIVIFNNGTYTQFRLIPPTTSTNGKIQKVNFISGDLASGATLDSYLCTTLNITTGTNLIQSLTDTDPKNGISVDITPSQNVFEQNGDSVIIKFNESAGINAGFAYDVTVEEGGIPFMTSVQVRGAKI